MPTTGRTPRVLGALTVPLVAPAVALAFALALLLGGCGPGPEKLMGATRPTPIDVHDLSLPDVTTTAPTPRLTFAPPRGTLLIQYFGYTSCPDVCPTTLADLRDAFARLSARDLRAVDLAMATVDAERDTPEVLNGYVGSFFPKFHVLRTSDTSELARVEERFGASSSVVKAADGAVEVAHSAWTYVIDHQGRVVVEWPFGTSAKDMAHDLKILISHARKAADA